MGTLLHLRIIVLSALWLAVVGIVSAQEGGAWHENKTGGRQAGLTKEHVMSRWGNITVVQVDYQLFVQFKEDPRVHLYTDKKPRCVLRATLLNSGRVFIQGCSRTFVADLSGVVQYKLRRFWFFDIATNQIGTRFAVFERGRSAWHDFANGSYDKLRLMVYSTGDGKKLYERRWRQEPDELVTEARIALSDYGSTLYLYQNRTTTYFIGPER